VSGLFGGKRPKNFFDSANCGIREKKIIKHFFGLKIEKKYIIGPKSSQAKSTCLSINNKGPIDVAV
jgi:hypothetical protein